MRLGNFNQEEYRIVETLVQNRCPSRYANMYNQKVVVNGFRGEGKIYSVFAHVILNHEQHLPR